MASEASTATSVVKIGTRGSPLALAQAYMTRNLLRVILISAFCLAALPHNLMSNIVGLCFKVSMKQGVMV